MQYPVTGPVGRDEVRERRALGRSEFQVTHIEIDAAGIGQEAPISRRLIVSALVAIQNTALLNPENMITQTMGNPCRRVFRAVLVNEQTIFGFKTENSIQHVTHSQRD